MQLDMHFIHVARLHRNDVLYHLLPEVGPVAS